MGVQKPPFPLAPTRPGKWGVFSKKSPFSLCSLVEKRGFFDRKLPFPGRGEMGVFGPRNPLFQEMCIWGPVWGRGLDDRRITHLICTRLNYDQYDFFRGVLGLLPVLFLVYEAHKHPLKTSCRSFVRRARTK